VKERVGIAVGERRSPSFRPALQRHGREPTVHEHGTLAIEARREIGRALGRRLRPGTSNQTFSPRGGFELAHDGGRPKAPAVDPARQSDIEEGQECRRHGEDAECDEQLGADPGAADPAVQELAHGEPSAQDHPCGRQRVDPPVEPDPGRVARRDPPIREEADRQRREGKHREETQPPARASLHPRRERLSHEKPEDDRHDEGGQRGRTPPRAGPRQREHGGGPSEDAEPSATSAAVCEQEHHQQRGCGDPHETRKGELWDCDRGEEREREGRRPVAKERGRRRGR